MAFLLPPLFRLYVQVKFTEAVHEKLGRIRDAIAHGFRNRVREIAMEYPRRGHRLLGAVKNWYDLIFLELGLKKNVVFLLKNGLKFKYVPGLFNFEVFLDDPYKSVEVRSKQVIDVGAFNGDSAIYFSTRGAKIVYAFEPYPLAYDLAQENLRLNRINNIILFNEALGSNESEIIVDPTYRSHQASILRSFDRGKKIPVRSLASLIERFNILDGVLKLDCEGCEYEAILSADLWTLDSFSDIILEYHHSSRELIEKLHAAGFRVKVLKDYGTNEGGILLATSQA